MEGIQGALLTCRPCTRGLDFPQVLSPWLEGLRGPPGHDEVTSDCVLEVWSPADTEGPLHRRSYG